MKILQQFLASNNEYTNANVNYLLLLAGHNNVSLSMHV